MAAQLPHADFGLIPAAVRERIPGCEDGRPPLAAWVLPGGGRNDVWRIDTPQGRFVWRSRRVPRDRPGSAAATELLVQQCVAAAGLAPQVMAAHPGGHWMLMPFMEGEAWTTQHLHEPARVAALASRLAMLHALPVPAGMPRVDAAGIARGYVAQLHAKGMTATSLALCVDEVASLAAELDAGGVPPVLVHGDLVVANLLGPAPMLIDWEYAQHADPAWDLACLLSYYPDVPLQAPLLDALGMAGPEARERLALQQRIFAILNSLWTRVHLPIAD